MDTPDGATRGVCAGLKAVETNGGHVSPASCCSRRPTSQQGRGRSAYKTLICGMGVDHELRPCLHPTVIFSGAKVLRFVLTLSTLAALLVPITVFAQSPGPQAPAGTAPRQTPAATTPATRQSPSQGQVWVNTKSKVYHCRRSLLRKNEGRQIHVRGRR